MSKLIKKRYYPAATPHKSVTPVDAADVVLGDALSLISAQIINLRNRVSMGATLRPDEVKMLCTMVDSMIKMSKEQREREADVDLSTLSDAELLDLLEKKAKGQTEGSNA